MQKFFPRVLAVSRKIDVFNERVGKIFSLLSLPLMFIVCIEVVLRYFFSKPTLWAWDVNIMLSCAVVCACAPYALNAGVFVVVDIIVSRFPKRRRAIIDLFLFLPLIFVLIMILYTGWFDTFDAVLTKKLYSSVWRPPIYPLYILIYISCILLFLQGFSKFVKDIEIALGEKKCQ